MFNSILSITKVALVMLDLKARAQLSHHHNLSSEVRSNGLTMLRTSVTGEMHK